MAVTTLVLERTVDRYDNVSWILSLCAEEEFPPNSTMQSVLTSHCDSAIILAHIPDDPVENPDSQVDRQLAEIPLEPVSELKPLKTRFKELNEAESNN